MHILTLNAGSSSLKFSVIEAAGERIIVQGSADWASMPTRYTFGALNSETIQLDVDGSDFASMVRRVGFDLNNLNNIDNSVVAVAHRIVHGGIRFTEPVLLTDVTEASLRELIPLAPLHNPFGLEVIAAARQSFPGLPHVAIFDTAFHATLAPEAYTYPVPYKWTENWNARRFGFHGLSHAYCASRAAEMIACRGTDLRLVVAHLGHGASVAAVLNGKSVDTTMGFTPLEGLAMATRGGSVDPGLLLYIQREHGISAEELDRILNHESGLLGVSGVSGDMRKLEKAADFGNKRAQLAIGIYVHRLRQAIAAMAASLGGLDALVFTGGIGENSARIRQAVCQRLTFLGLELDTAANRADHPDQIISTPASAAQILVLATQENLMLCREATRLLNGATGS